MLIFKDIKAERTAAKEGDDLYMESLRVVRDSLTDLLNKFVKDGDDRAIQVKSAIDETEVVINNFSEKRFADLIAKLQEAGLVEVVSYDEDEGEDYE